MQIALSFLGRWAAPSSLTDNARTAPDPRRRSGPVFIHDAITPWAGETMLLSRLRADALRDLDDDQPE